MFKNFKVTTHMATPIATIGYIILDSVISAAIAKDKVKDEYYAGANICGTKEQIDEWLGEVLDKKQGVYCTSIGIGENKEFVGTWAKRWDDRHDDIVTGFKGITRVDIGAGHFKNYHMPIVLKSYSRIEFYVRGNLEEVERLLNNYIFYLGKKGSQGYGQVRKWEFEEIEEDWSLWENGKPMRPIPAKECIYYIENNNYNLQTYSTIPPYWRDDCRELCLMPEV